MRRWRTWNDKLESTEYWRRCWAGRHSPVRAGRHSPVRAVFERMGLEVPPPPPEHLDPTLGWKAEEIGRTAKAAAASERRQKRPSNAVPRAVRKREQQEGGGATGATA